MRRSHLVLSAEDQRIGVIRFSQQVLGIVQPRIGKELRARHPVAIDQNAAAALFCLTSQKSQSVLQKACGRSTE
jgi:hypothetical protein